MIDSWPLLLARLIHYATLVPLAGLLLYPLHSGSLIPAPLWAQTTHRLARPTMLLAAIALFSAAGWLGAALVAMAGSVEGALDPAVQSFVLFDSAFGQLWLVRLSLALLLGALLLAAPRFAWIAATLLLLGLAGTGHTQVNAYPLRALHMANDALHLLAAALWLGGLIPLALALRNCREPEILAPVLHRFSAMGYAAVATLAVTGVINLLMSAEAPLALLSTLWGCLLVAKLAAFGAMLLLAASNRFRLLARLGGMSPGAEANGLRVRLIHHVQAEQILGLVILALVAALGMTALP